MKNSLVIIGAGGHGRVCAEIAELNGYQKILFLDDGNAGNIEIAGKTEDFIKYLSDCDFFVAIGNNNVRRSFLYRIMENKGQIATLIHPDSTVSAHATVGVGTAVMAGAVINTGTVIGKGAIINTCSSVDHDCRIGDFAHVSVGAHLAGTVSVGERCFVGAGAIVINNISICKDCIIGAGSTVISDIKKEGTYVGSPVRKIK